MSATRKFEWYSLIMVDKVTVKVRFLRGEIAEESCWEVRVTGRGPVELYPAVNREHADEMAKEIRAEIRADRKKLAEQRKAQ